MGYAALLLVAVLVGVTSAYPFAFPDDPYSPPAPVYAPPAPSYGKAEVGREKVQVRRSYKPEPAYHEPVGYGPKEVGRVKIQVYRGPNDKKCAYDDPYCVEFAPWGYYNTQPADLKIKKYYH